MKSTLLSGVVLLGIGLLFCGGAKAQGVGSSADLNGTITDPTGSGVPNASVTVTETSKGTQRSVESDERGFYRLAGLAPAVYKVSVQRTGFQTEVVTGVVLSLGQTVVLDIHLKLSGVSAQVEVSSELPIVETERGGQSNSLTQDYIAELPIDRRDYLTFTLLAPGVSNSTRLASDQDFRVKQTPQSGLSFYASNGRGNAVTVDGAEVNDDAGGVRLNLSQDAVQEFEVNRSNYTAEFGGASGATINIVSRSGSKDLHGGLYGFFRNDAMDAADPFARSQALPPGGIFDPSKPDTSFSNVKNTLTRYQFGGNVGFPIVKDKSFLFASFESLRQDSQNAVPILTSTSILRPTTDQQAIINGLAAQGGTVVTCFQGVMIPAVACANLLESGLTVSQLTGLSAGQNALNTFLVNELESNGGLFNYHTRSYLVSGRYDQPFSERNQFALSYRYGHDLEENPDVQSLTGFSAGSSVKTWDNNVMAAWYHQFSSATHNEARFQFNYYNFKVIPNSPGQAGLQIPGFVNNLGTNIFLPSFTTGRRYEFADNVTLVRGNHTIKVGGYELLRGNHTESHTFFPGRFVFGSLPGALISPQLGNTLINPLQAASFGLPQVFQQGFGNPVYPYENRPFTAFYGQDSWRITPSLTLNYGLRYELDTQYAPLSTYKKNFGPRVSFAWDPFHDHKTVIRGGYGIYDAQIYFQIPGVDLSLGVLNANGSSVGNSTKAGQVNNLTAICGIEGVFPGSGSSPCNREVSIYIIPISPLVPGSPLNAPNVFQTLFAQGAITCTTPAAHSYACITPGPGPGGLAQFGLNVANSGPLSPLQVVFVEQPNFRNPYSQQAGLGIEREITPGFSVSVSYIYTHTIGLPVALDTNLLNAPLTQVTLANGKAVQYRNWNGGVPPGQAAPADPLGGQETIVSGPAAGQKVIDAGYPCANPFACFVNPLIVQNNQYTSAGSAVYQGGILEVKKRIKEHFTVFGNYTFSKGFDTTTDFNSDYGPQDPTNLGADRGLSEFDQRHKVVVAGVFDSPWKGAVLSGFQLAPIFTYNSGHPFNLLAGGEVNGNNHTTNERPLGAGRDTGLGPDYTSFDMRLSWQHKLAEKATLKFTAEAFNLANHTNFASVNNVVGPLFGIAPPGTQPCPVAGGCPIGNASFNVHGTSASLPNQLLGFTSAFPKRVFQLGLRLTF
jgi:hypothetical protein